MIWLWPMVIVVFYSIFNPRRDVTVTLVCLIIKIIIDSTYFSFSFKIHADVRSERRSSEPNPLCQRTAWVPLLLHWRGKRQPQHRRTRDASAWRCGDLWHQMYHQTVSQELYELGRDVSVSVGAFRQLHSPQDRYHGRFWNMDF